MALVGALLRDGGAALEALGGEELASPATEAVELLAIVVGQGIDASADGVFRIARRVAPERDISTLDTKARHGHKSHHRLFDGYS